MNAPTLSILSLILLAGCAGADAGTGGAVSLGEVVGVRDGQVELAVGQTLAIALPSNATTGYAWRVSREEAGVLVPGTPFGDEITDPHAPGMVGVGGMTQWRFVAARPGSATLSFAYGRPWERDAPPAETATYRVRVR